MKTPTPWRERLIKRSKGHRKTALRAALASVARTQGEFWDAVDEFEKLAGVELDSSHDFTGFDNPSDADVESIIQAAPVSHEFRS